MRSTNIWSLGYRSNAQSIQISKVSIFYGTTTKISFTEGIINRSSMTSRVT